MVDMTAPSPGRPRGRPAILRPCGTRAAAERHRRAGEPLCEPCRAALAAYQHAQYVQRLRRRQLAELDR